MANLKMIPTNFILMLTHQFIRIMAVVIENIFVNELFKMFSTVKRILVSFPEND